MRSAFMCQVSCAYHRVGFTTTGLTVGEETAMITIPGVIQHLFSEGIIDLLLVCIPATLRNIITFAIYVEAIMRPKAVVKSKSL